jgi:hypothetical protein
LCQDTAATLLRSWIKDVAMCFSARSLFYNKRVPFTRQGKKIIFDSEEQDSSPVNILLHILKAIRKAQVQ